MECLCLCWKREREGREGRRESVGEREEERDRERLGKREEERERELVKQIEYGKKQKEREEKKSNELRNRTSQESVNAGKTNRPTPSPMSSLST